MSNAKAESVSKAPEMNELQKLQNLLASAFPAARITVDEPLVKGGVWLLDLFLPDYHLAVAWRKDKGFGIVSNDMHGYGEGADEVYDTLEDALPMLLELVAGRQTTPSGKSLDAN